MSIRPPQSSGRSHRIAISTAAPVSLPPPGRDGGRSFQRVGSSGSGEAGLSSSRRSSVITRWAPPRVDVTGTGGLRAFLGVTQMSTVRGVGTGGCSEPAEGASAAGHQGGRPAAYRGDQQAGQQQRAERGEPGPDRREARVLDRQDRARAGRAGRPPDRGPLAARAPARQSSGTPPARAPRPCVRARPSARHWRRRRCSLRAGSGRRARSPNRSPGRACRGASESAPPAGRRARIRE